MQDTAAINTAHKVRDWFRDNRVLHSSFMGLPWCFPTIGNESQTAENAHRAHRDDCIKDPIFNNRTAI